MIILLPLALYFVAALLIPSVGRRAPKLVGPLAVTPYIIQLGAVAWIASNGDVARVAQLEWVPSLGIVIGLAADPINLMLTTLVAGIGLLIVVYSAAYFSDPAKKARFIALVLAFTGGMAGIVASNELLGLFVFWEVTTVVSYLLIGFNDEDEKSRSAALQAILVTASGGLAMLAGFVLLAQAAGTTSIPDIVAAPPTGTGVTAALLLIFVGALSKSAQVPFHFWLPGAMAAPTPASAFLHSATMVNAGVVLLLFLAPGFASTTVWIVVVTTAGLATMVVGALGAMQQTDLKLLLAYGTVSQLGFMTALIGLGHTGAALAVLVSHALFKAALFLVVGVIDKGTGTREIPSLSGLGRTAPGLATTAGLAALSMAGVIPLLGFVAKEAAFDVLIASADWYALGVIAAASVLTVSYAARFWFGAFTTKVGVEPIERAPVGLGMTAPPTILAVLSLAFGLFPKGLGSLTSSAVGEVTKLVLWPGLKPALAVSAAVLVAGSGLFVLQRRLERTPNRRLIPQWPFSTATSWYLASLRTLNTTAERTTGIVQNGSLPVYVAVIVTTVVSIPAVVWLAGADGLPELRITNGPAEVILAVVAIAGAVAATRAQRRMAAALLLGVVGYAVSGIYIVFGAPDLALTQVLIETLTIALFALVLAKLPRRFGADPRSLSRPIRIGVSILVGAVIAGAAALANTGIPDRTVAEAYIELAPEAGGRNVVNIILTNFRALDTLGEITVLAAAAVGIAALVGARSRNREREDAL